MELIEKAYKLGCETSKMLMHINAGVNGDLEDSENIDPVIIQCRSKLAYDFAFTLTSTKYKEISHKYWLMQENRLPSDKEFIRRLENIYLQALRELCKANNSSVIAFGYYNIDDAYPIKIPQKDWRFLEIDKENNTASCDGRKYRDVRFIVVEEFVVGKLKGELTTTELRELMSQSEVNNRNTEPPPTIGESIYSKRERNFTAWQAERGVDINLLKVEEIYNQINEEDKLKEGVDSK